MASRTRYTKAKIAKALKASGGIQSAAAELLGCTRETVAHAVARWPELRDVIDEATEEIVDLAERQLFSAVRDGNMTAIIFALKCRGKRRGYVERHEQTGANGGPIALSRPLSELSDDELRRIVDGQPAAQSGGRVGDAPPSAVALKSA